MYFILNYDNTDSVSVHITFNFWWLTFLLKFEADNLPQGFLHLRMILEFVWFELQELSQWCFPIANHLKTQVTHDPTCHKVAVIKSSILINMSQGNLLNCGLSLFRWTYLEIELKINTVWKQMIRPTNSLTFPIVLKFS